MGHALFTGWTDHQLQGAFKMATDELHAAQSKARNAASWQDIAYIAMLTGGDIPKVPTC